MFQYLKLQIWLTLQVIIQVQQDKQGVFHRDALALAMMQDLKIETQRDASLRADEIVATAVYGVGELNDTYGVEVNSDSSIQ